MATTAAACRQGYKQCIGDTKALAAVTRPFASQMLALVVVLAAAVAVATSCCDDGALSCCVRGYDYWRVHAPSPQCPQHSRVIFGAHTTAMHVLTTPRYRNSACYVAGAQLVAATDNQCSGACTPYVVSMAVAATTSLLTSCCTEQQLLGDSGDAVTDAECAAARQHLLTNASVLMRYNSGMIDVPVCTDKDGGDDEHQRVELAPTPAPTLTFEDEVLDELDDIESQNTWIGIGVALILLIMLVWFMWWCIAVCCVSTKSSEQIAAAARMQSTGSRGRLASVSRLY